MKPPSEFTPAGTADGDPTRRTILARSRKLQQQHSGDSSSSTSVVSLNGGTATPVLFGCVTDEQGQIYRQKADGILGLADEALSVPKQLAGSGATSDTFTLCYGSHSGVKRNSQQGSTQAGECTMRAKRKPRAQHTVAGPTSYSTHIVMSSDVMMLSVEWIG